MFLYTLPYLRSTKLQRMEMGDKKRDVWHKSNYNSLATTPSIALVAARDQSKNYQHELRKRLCSLEEVLATQVLSKAKEV